EQAAQQKAEAEAKRKAEQAAQQKAEAEAKRKAEQAAQQKAEAEAKRLAELAAEQQRQLEARQQAQREAEAKRQAELQAAEAARQAAAEQAQRLAEQQAAQARMREREQLIMRINDKVKGAWIRPITSRKGLVCKIRVRLLPDGTVISVRTVDSSGDVLFDRSAENAVKKASPLPFPSTPELVQEFREFNFNFKPE
ncbi:MAG: cell envelope integrity protein TolA, partial [Methylococcales bacterium]|nr:cell envelope integrity protein TolA [Methylococcales bacterium]